MSGEDRVGALEGRLTGLSALLRGIMTRLVLSGAFTGATIEEILKEAEDVLRESDDAPQRALAELGEIRASLPGYLRAAMGPPPDPAFEDH